MCLSALLILNNKTAPQVLQTCGFIVYKPTRSNRKASANLKRNQFYFILTSKPLQFWPANLPGD